MVKFLLSILILAAVFADGLALMCYSRSSSTLNTDGTSTNCTSGETTCRTYSLLTVAYGSCGTCSSTSATDCTTCSTDNCNTKPASISCYSAAGIGTLSSSTLSNCVVGVCYKYSTNFFGTTLFYAGCGTCSSTSSGCTTCSSSSCNSASSVGVSVKLATAGVMLLALMKLF